MAQDVELTRTPSQNLILTLSQNPQGLTCSEMTTHIVAGVPVATVSTCKEQVLKKGISLSTNFMFCGKHLVIVNKELRFS